MASGLALEVEDFGNLPLLVAGRVFQYLRAELESCSFVGASILLRPTNPAARQAEVLASAGARLLPPPWYFPPEEYTREWSFNQCVIRLAEMRRAQGLDDIPFHLWRLEEEQESSGTGCQACAEVNTVTVERAASLKALSVVPLRKHTSEPCWGTLNVFYGRQFPLLPPGEDLVQELREACPLCPPLLCATEHYPGTFTPPGPELTTTLVGKLKERVKPINQALLDAAAYLSWALRERLTASRPPFVRELTAAPSADRASR